MVTSIITALEEKKTTDLSNIEQALSENLYLTVGQ
jgi:hypothetical protein